MANVSLLLNQATGKAAIVEKRLADIGANDPNKESPTESATRMQLMHTWKQSSITQEMFSSIGAMAKKYEHLAAELAGNSFDEEARIKVTHLLIKAKALRDIIIQFTQ